MTRPTYSPRRVLAVIALAVVTVLYLAAVAGNTSPRPSDHYRPVHPPSSFVLVPPTRVDNPTLPEVQ